MLRKLSALFIVTAILLGATSAWSADYKTTLTLTVAASSPTYDEAYTFTQPENLTITQSGWNSLGNITASYGGSNAGFDSSKKLVVTVTSTNNFNLKSGENSIGYVHATDNNSTEATTTFEFSAAEINATGGTSKAVGVNVADYSSAAAGTYTDEITYTVAIEDVSTTTTTTVTWTGSDITTDSDNPFTKDGVTLAADEIANATVFAPATFTTTLGNFTKIEVTASGLDNLSGDGWSVANGTATWTGTASNSVSFEGSSTGSSITGISTIVFTIEQ